MGSTGDPGWYRIILLHQSVALCALHGIHNARLRIAAVALEGSKVKRSNNQLVRGEARIPTIKTPDRLSLSMIIKSVPLGKNDFFRPLYLIKNNYFEI